MHRRPRGPTRSDRGLYEGQGPEGPALAVRQVRAAARRRNSHHHDQIERRGTNFHSDARSEPSSKPSIRPGETIQPQTKEFAQLAADLAKVRPAQRLERILGQARGRVCRACQRRSTRRPRPRTKRGHRSPGRPRLVVHRVPSPAPRRTGNGGGPAAGPAGGGPPTVVVRRTRRRTPPRAVPPAAASPSCLNEPGLNRVWHGTESAHRVSRLIPNDEPPGSPFAG